MTDASAPGSSLTVFGGPLNGKRLALKPGLEEVLIGSGPDCHLRLELPGVSAVHARLRISGGGVAVLDPPSARGVFVNDERVVGSRPVHDGDVLWLGPPTDASSVMIRCRLAPAARSRISQPEAAQAADEFFVEDGAPPPAAVSDAEAFVLDEESTPPAPLDIPPAATAPEDDGFFVMEEEAAPPLPPPKPVRPAAPPRPPAPSSPPRAAAPPAAPAKAPAAKPPPAQVPPTKAPAPAASPHPPAAAHPAQAHPPAPGAARAPAEARPPAPAAAPPPHEGRPAPPPPAPTPAAAPPPRATPSPASASAPAPPAPPPPAAPRPVSPPRSTAAPAPPRPRPTTAPRPRAAVPAPSAKAPSKRLPLVGIVAAALLVVSGVAYVGLRSLRRPEILGVSPTRARIGETATLTGKGFAASSDQNVVLFGDVRAAVREASRQRLVVEVPELPATAGRDMSFPVTVRVGGRESQPVAIAVFKAPRIHGLSPDVAMPGEEVTLAGSGWGPNAIVRFGSLAAEVLDNAPEAIRVRVPAIEGPPGTPAPVTVAMGPDASNEAPFLLGRLPLVQSIEPSSAAPGDLVTLTGRGFHWKAAENAVRVGGVRAFVAAVGEGSLKFAVPWTSGAGGEVPVELRVPSIENTWQGVLTVQPGADPIDFRFAVEPLDAVPSSPHAVLATGLGPAFVLAAAEKRTAADRALEAQRRLNDAATALKASRDVNFEVRNLETNPVLVLAGRPEAILEVSDEDAAAYNEDWTRLGGKGGPVTRARLALWWQAVARDLVLLLLRGEKPRHAAALAPEGRVLGDVFEAARKTGSFGVPRSVVATAKPPMIAALRTLALRVPASVTAGIPEAPQTAKSAAAASPSPPPLQLEGMWVGTELEGGTRKYVTVTFRGRGGFLAYEGGISVSVPLLTLDQPQKDAVRYSIEYRGGQRYYLGRWDGRKITGRISSDASGRGDVGAFELSPR